MSIQFEAVGLNGGLNAAEIIAGVAHQVPMVDYKPEWANGTGYFDNAVNEKFESNAIVHFTDETNRIGLILPTPVGNLVLFQRYSNGGNGIATFNVAPALRSLAGAMGLESNLHPDKLFAALADYGNVNGTWFISEDCNPIAAVVLPIINNALLRATKGKASAIDSDYFAKSVAEANNK